MKSGEDVQGEDEVVLETETPLYPMPTPGQRSTARRGTLKLALLTVLLEHCWLRDLQSRNCQKVHL